MVTSMGPQTPSSANKGPMINAVVWIGAGVALLLVLLRLFTRAKIVGKVGLDDYVMVFAMVSQVGHIRMRTMFDLITRFWMLSACPL